MRAVPLLLVSALTLAFAASAGAQAPGKKKLYRWTDAQGNVHYTDALPPEAAKAARDTLNEGGMAVEHQARAPTDEERAAQQAEAAKNAEANRIAEEQKKMDTVLVSSYPTEADLKRAYDERFDLLEQSVESARVGIRSQEKSLSDLLAHAGELERGGKPVPPTVVESIGRSRAQVADQRAYLAKREAERTALQAEFDSLLARYRTLTADKAGEKPATP